MEKKLVWGGLWQYCDASLLTEDLYIKPQLSIIYLIFGIDLTWNVVAIIIIIKGAGGDLGDNGYVYGLNGGNVSMSIYLSPISSSCTN